MNANQLSEALDLDYKTIRHHLEILCENDVLTTMGEGYGMTYFLTNNMEENLDVLDEVARKAEAAGKLSTSSSAKSSNATPRAIEGEDDEQE